MRETDVRYTEVSDIMQIFVDNLQSVNRIILHTIYKNHMNIKSVLVVVHY